MKQSALSKNPESIRENDRLNRKIEILYHHNFSSQYLLNFINCKVVCLSKLNFRLRKFSEWWKTLDLWLPDHNHGLIFSEQKQINSISFAKRNKNITLRRIFILFLQVQLKEETLAQNEVEAVNVTQSNILLRVIPLKKE